MRKLCAFFTLLAVVISADASPKMVCYYPNWAYYRTGTAKFTTDNIDTSLCTHVVYAFAILNATSLTIQPYDNWLDIQLFNYAKAVALKTKNPNIKVLIAIGGWNDSHFTSQYSNMAAISTSIAKFTNSVVTFLQTYGFDGLDLDWEYPAAADKTNFANLVKALRASFGTKYQLTMAASASPATLDSSYDVPTLSLNLDAIHLMTYDMHGSWETNADSHAPLYKRSWEADGNNVNYTVNYWIQKGASPSKLVLGIPTYGKTWKLASLSSIVPPNAIGAGAGSAGPFTAEAGTLAYSEICSNIKAGGWTVVQDASGNAGPYAYSSATLDWVSYDDVAMVRKKATYAKDKSLGGAMVWDISMDDFKNMCGTGSNPLLTAIVNTLNSGTTTISTTTAPVVTTKATVTTTTTKPVTISTTKVSTTTTKPVTISTTKVSTTTTKPVTTSTTKVSAVTTTGATTKLPSGTFVCPRDGLFACPTDCSKFYNCFGGIAYLQSCGQGTLFNSVLKYCDWPANVVCPLKTIRGMS